MIMWQCPDCKRHFVKESSNHVCKSFSEKDYLDKKPKNIIECYEHLKSIILSWENVIAEPNSYGLEFMGNRRFAAVIPQAGHLIIGFYLNYPIEEFPIEHCEQISRNRYSHSLKIDEIDDIDSQLINWLHESYINIGTV